jgi:hypothetical protein
VTQDDHIFGQGESIQYPNPEKMGAVPMFVFLSSVSTDFVRNHRALPLPFKHIECAGDREIEKVHELVRLATSSVNAYDLSQGTVQLWIIQRLPVVQYNLALHSQYLQLYELVSASMFTRAMVAPAISLIANPSYRFPNELLEIFERLLSRHPKLQLNATPEPIDFFRFDQKVGGGIQCPLMLWPREFRIETAVRVIHCPSSPRPLLTLVWKSLPPIGIAAVGTRSCSHASWASSSLVRFGCQSTMNFSGHSFLIR